MQGGQLEACVPQYEVLDTLCGGPSFDHLIRPLEKRRWDRQAERLGGLEVDDELELRGLLDG